MGTVTTTAAVTVFPTTNDVVGGSGYTSAGFGKTLGEDLLGRLLRAPFHGYAYVQSGGAYALVSGRTFRHNTAYCMVNGYMVVTKSTPETLTCEASSTCYTWLQLVRNASSQVTGARWVVTTVAGLPTLPTYGVTGDQVMFGYTTANASAITAQGDTPRGIIAPGRVFSEQVITANPGGSDKFVLPAFVGDGITPIRIEIWAPCMATSGAGGNTCTMRLRTAASGGGSAVQLTEIHNTAANYEMPCTLQYNMAANQNLNTMYGNLTTSAGTASIVAHANFPAYIRASWDVR